jgi:hypothetical protein
MKKVDPFNISLPEDVAIGITPMQPVRLTLMCMPCRRPLEPRSQVPRTNVLLMSQSSVMEYDIMHACPACNRQVSVPHAYPLITMMDADEFAQATQAEDTDTSEEMELVSSIRITADAITTE